MSTGRLRLLHLRDQAEAVGESMALQRGRFAALADPSAAPRVVVADNLFQTPEPIAARMAGLLAERMPAAGVLLEPSAGLGRLYRAARQAGHAGPVVLVDVSPDCCRELYGLTQDDGAAKLRQGDFLTMDPGPVDGVLMNPPFRRGADIRHIRHALTLLREGGRLVALCYGGPRQAAALRPLASLWEPLPPGAFREAGTMAVAVLLIIDK